MQRGEGHALFQFAAPQSSSALAARPHGTRIHPQGRRTRGGGSVVQVRRPRTRAIGLARSPTGVAVSEVWRASPRRLSRWQSAAAVRPRSHVRSPEREGPREGPGLASGVHARAPRHRGVRPGPSCKHSCTLIRLLRVQMPRKQRIVRTLRNELATAGLHGDFNGAPGDGCRWLDVCPTKRCGVPAQGWRPHQSVCRKTRPRTSRARPATAHSPADRLTDPANNTGQGC